MNAAIFRINEKLGTSNTGAEDSTAASGCERLSFGVAPRGRLMINSARLATQPPHVAIIRTH
jgi:hypothetical protein